MLSLRRLRQLDGIFHCVTRWSCASYLWSIHIHQDPYVWSIHIYPPTSISMNRPYQPLKIYIYDPSIPTNQDPYQWSIHTNRPISISMIHPYLPTKLHIFDPFTSWIAVLCSGCSFWMLSRVATCFSKSNLDVAKENPTCLERQGLSVPMFVVSIWVLVRVDCRDPVCKCYNYKNPIAIMVKAQSKRPWQTLF